MRVKYKAELLDWVTRHFAGILNKIIFAKKNLVFENRVLRIIFGPKRGEVTGEWRKFYNEELHHLYTSPNIVRVIKSRRIKWVWHVARMREERARCRWEDNIKEGH
jgi:hypothetical protein